MIAVGLVIDHHIRAVAHIAECIDALQVLVYRRAVVDQHVDDHLVGAGLELRHVGEHLQLREYEVFVLVSIPGEVHLLVSDAPEQFRLLLGHEPDVEALVEVYTCTGLHQLGEKVAPVWTRQDIRVVEYYLLLPSPELAHVGHLDGPLAFFAGYMAKRATARTAAGQIAVGCIVAILRVERIVGIDVFDRSGQRVIASPVISLHSILQRDGVAGASAYHLVGVDDQIVVRREAEDLTLVDDVVAVAPGRVPLHLVAHKFMVCR